MACDQRCDFNKDGKVDASDQSIIVSAYGSKIGDSNWNPACDFNGNGEVDSFDFVHFGESFGCTFGTPPPTGITCNSSTPNYSSGCALLLMFDQNNDGRIDSGEIGAAATMKAAGRITDDEYTFIKSAYNAGSINAVCPGCYTTTPPPQVCTPGTSRCAGSNAVEVCSSDGSRWIGTYCKSGEVCKVVGGRAQCVAGVAPPPATETRTTSLTEGNHSILISLSGYETLSATINVSSTGVKCTAGPCNTQGPPGVTTSGWTVTTYLKSGTTVSDVCAWIDGIGGWKNLQWASHVLEAYYVYIGASGHSVGFSPVTWDDVLGLYYYYINDPSAGNAKIGCGT